MRRLNNPWCLSLLLLAALVGWWPLATLAFVMTLLLACWRESDRGWPEVRSPWIWRFFLFLLVVPPILLGKQNFGGIPFSLTIFHQIGLILSRTVTIYIILVLLTDRLELQKLQAFCGLVLGPHMSLALVLALNLLPLLRSGALKTHCIMQLRGGLRRHRWRNLYQLAGAILMQAIVLAETTTDALQLHQRLEQQDDPPVN